MDIRYEWDPSTLSRRPIYYEPIKPIDPIIPTYTSPKIDPIIPTYTPPRIEPIKPLYNPIKIDPLPTYKPFNLDPIYKPKPLYDPIKIDPLPTYKLPDTKPLIGRWCSRQRKWCSEPICRRIYGLPPKHTHTDLTGHHDRW